MEALINEAGVEAVTGLSDEEFKRIKVMTFNDYLNIKVNKCFNKYDDDNVDLTFDQVWVILKKPHKDFTSVYNAFIIQYPSMKEDIDEIFMKHGFFMDKNRGNGKYDKGEAFIDKNDNGELDKGETFVDYAEGGISYDKGEKIGTASNYQRPARASSAQFRGHYIKVDNNVPYYKIKVLLKDKDYDGLPIPSGYYELRASNEDGIVYVPVPPVDAVITVEAEGVTTKNPLTFTSKQFRSKYAEALDKGYFVEHEFEIEGEIPKAPVSVFDEKGISTFVESIVSDAYVYVITMFNEDVINSMFDEDGFDEEKISTFVETVVTDASGYIVSMFDEEEIFTFDTIKKSSASIWLTATLVILVVVGIAVVLMRRKK